MGYKDFVGLLALINVAKSSLIDRNWSKNLKMIAERTDREDSKGKQIEVEPSPL